MWKQLQLILILLKDEPKCFSVLGSPLFVLTMIMHAIWVLSSVQSNLSAAIIAQHQRTLWISMPFASKCRLCQHLSMIKDILKCIPTPRPNKTPKTSARLPVDNVPPPPQATQSLKKAMEYVAYANK